MEQEPNNFSLSFEVDGVLLECTYLNTWVVEYQDPLWTDHAHIQQSGDREVIIFDSGNEREMLLEYGWGVVLLSEPSDVVKEAYITHQTSMLDAELAVFEGRDVE